MVRSWISFLVNIHKLFRDRRENNRQALLTKDSHGLRIPFEPQVTGAA